MPGRPRIVECASCGRLRPNKGRGLCGGCSTFERRICAVCPRSYQRRHLYDPLSARAACDDICGE